MLRASMWQSKQQELVAISIAFVIPLAILAKGQPEQACQQSTEFCIKSLVSSSGLEGANGTRDLVLKAISATQAALDGINDELQMLNSMLGGGTPATAPTSNQSWVESNNVAKPALHDCVEFLTDASELIGTSLSSSLNSTQLNSSSVSSDIRTWMSAALTYHTTCMDGFDDVPGSKELATEMRTRGDKVDKMLSKALAVIASMYSPVTQAEEDSSKRAATSTPDWVVEEHLLKAVNANVVVARDGSGRYLTISEAIAAAPNNSDLKYVIYIRQGTYKERVVVPKSKTNLMFVGDGIGKTIITGSKSVHDRVTTFKTATLAIEERGFLGRHLTIRNTAGAAKNQAVALRVSADKVAFYKCSFEGYQDTLYAHVFRQFYRECNVYGTVDFIFGNAAAVFQSCALFARRPVHKQKNTYTAQGRTDLNQNTGFSFQNCTLDGTKGLKHAKGISTYLGRPWKLYSRTVFLECYEGSLINSAGWLEWSGEFALKTLFYGEYLCGGPGSAAGNRVSWSTQITSASQASQFTPSSFISGADWLGGTDLPYKLGL